MIRARNELAMFDQKHLLSVEVDLCGMDRQQKLAKQYNVNLCPQFELLYVTKNDP